MQIDGAQETPKADDSMQIDEEPAEPATTTDVNELSLGQRLEMLAADQEKRDATKTAASSKAAPETPAKDRRTSTIPVPAASLSTVMNQALLTMDNQLFDSCIIHSDTKVIVNTVRRLPVEYIIPFFESVLRRFNEPPGECSNLIEWIRQAVIIHAGYLLTVRRLLVNITELV